MIKKLLSLQIMLLITWFNCISSPLPDFYPRNWNVDVRHYSFWLELSDNTDIIQGKALINISFSNIVQELFLDLINADSTGKGMTVKSVVVDGEKIPYKHLDNRLQITPAEPFQKGSNSLFTIVYEGTPKDGLIISGNKYGDRTFFGDNWPDRARHWLPCVDHPSDKASVDWIISAPVTYQVIGNGVLIEESNLTEGLKLTHWFESVDISTKVMVIGVSRFAVGLSGMMRDIPVQAWVYPQDREEGFHDYAPGVEILHFFDTLVGPYSYKKLANVQSKTRFGGMENASNIFYSENSVTGKGNINELIAHEIAHQWFGNSASEKDWHHVWLSEGFATYFTRLYVENVKGEAVFRKQLEDARNTVIKYYDTNPVPVVNSLIKDNMKLLNPNSYQKGGWVLHMLRNKIGYQNFIEGIRLYYKTYMNSNALTEDLKNVMENVSGMELDGFFNQWIFTAGQPELNVTWLFDSKKGQIKIKIEQKQENIFVFPLEILVNNQIYIADISDPEETFTFQTSKNPKGITLDPNVKLLFRASVQKK